MTNLRRTTFLLILMVPVVTSAQKIENNFDKFGNVIGDQYGLAEKNEFRGKRILIWSGDSQVYGHIYDDKNALWDALAEKGFEVIKKKDTFDPKWLENADQMWIFSGNRSHMDEAGYKAVIKYIASGKGVYLASDNSPYHVEAGEIAKRLWGVTISGNYIGQQTVGVQRLEPAKEAESKKNALVGEQPKSDPSKVKLPGNVARINTTKIHANHIVQDHSLLTDINYIYEGITISHISPNDRLKTVLTASDGQILAAVSTDPGQRVLVDCGWTRYYTMYTSETAGTLRYAQNIAAYLMGKERDGFHHFSRIDVLGRLKSLTDPKLKNRERVIIELAQISPKYSQVKEDLAKIWKLHNLDDPDIRRAVQDQMANAFIRAPMSETLAWLGKADKDLQKLIWQQVDLRIARASEQRLASYRATSLRLIAEKESPLKTKLAALDLLDRLADKSSVKPLVDLLKTMPRELWPGAGKLLKKLTRQSFGPKEGDGFADVFIAHKKWAEWLQENPTR